MSMNDYDKSLSKIYNYSPAYPSVEAVPIDVETADQGPTVCIRINRQLIPYLAGLCEVYRNPGFFRGDEARRVKSAEILTDLQALILNADECATQNTTVIVEGCTMPLGSIIWTIAAPQGGTWLRLNGQTVSATDYPELASIVPVSWTVGLDNGIKLPNMSETILQGVGAGDLGVGVTFNSNDHTLTLSQMPAHSHDFQDSPSGVDVLNANQQSLNFQNRGVQEAFSNLGRRFIDGDNAQTAQAGNGQSFSVEQRALHVMAYICASTSTVLEVEPGPAGPTGADGPPGPEGPIGPNGSAGPAGDCDCEPDIDPLPDDVFVPDIGEAPTPTQNICAGARRVAQSMREDLSLIFDALDAIADTVPAPLRKIKNFPGMGTYLSFLSAIAPAVIVGMRAENNLALEDEIVCNLYCAIMANGGFNAQSYSDFSDNYTGSVLDDPVASVAVVDSVRALVGFALRFGGSYSSTYGQYQAGAVNEDNYCEQFCDCQCSSSSGGPIVSLDLNHPSITFYPAPFYNATEDRYEWAANTWGNVRIAFNESRCVSAVNFNLVWNDGENPGPLRFVNGDQSVIDTSGGGNAGNFSGAFAVAQRSRFIMLQPTDTSKLQFRLFVRASSTIASSP